MPEYTISFPNKEKLRSIPEHVINQIPYFVNWLSFDNSSSANDKKHYKFRLKNSLELKYEPLEMIIHYLYAGECRYKINDVGTLRGLRHTALFLGCSHVLEQLVGSEKKYIEAKTFLEAGFPLKAIFKHFSQDLLLVQYALEMNYPLEELHPLVGSYCLIEAGVSQKKLLDFGVSFSELRTLTDKLKRATDRYWPFDITPKDCIERNIPLRDNFNDLDLTLSGCKLNELKAAGVDPKILIEAEISCSELREIGYDFDDLKDLFSLWELIEAGFRFERLRGLKDRIHRECWKPTHACALCAKAGATLQELIDWGFDLASLNGSLAFKVSELRTLFPESTLQDFGNRAIPDLLEGGYTISEVIDTERNDDGDIEDYKRRGAKLSNFKAAGFDVKRLKKTFPWSEWKKEFSCQELAEIFSIKELKTMFTCFELREIYPLSKLKTVFNCIELAKAGFTSLELYQEGFSKKKLKEAFPLEELEKLPCLRFFSFKKTKEENDETEESNCCILM